MFYVWYFIGIFTAIDLEDTSSAQEAFRTRQCNFVAFAARLTQSGLADRSEYFFVPEGFEEEFDPRSKAYLRQGPQLDVYVVPLAGIWILLCGNIIFAHCRNRVTPDYNDAGKNWKWANGFSIEWWVFFLEEEIFGEIKGHDQASEKTKELAAEGEGLMSVHE